LLTTSDSTSWASSSGRQLQHRLGWKEDRPFGHRAHFAAERERRKPLQEGGAEQSRRLEEREILFAESQSLKVLERVLDPGRDEIAPAVGKPSAVELERRRPLGDPLGDIALAHRELVQVDEKSRHFAGNANRQPGRPHFVG
jgi:hypothetical protein